MFSGFSCHETTKMLRFSGYMHSKKCKKRVPYIGAGWLSQLENSTAELVRLGIFNKPMGVPNISREVLPFKHPLINPYAPWDERYI